MQVLGQEIGSVVGTKMLRGSLLHQHLGQRFDQPGQCPTPFGTDQQALARVFIDEVEQSRSTSIMRAHAHEVVVPHRVSMRRPETHAGTIVEAKRPRGFCICETFRPSRC